MTRLKILLGQAAALLILSSLITPAALLAADNPRVLMKTSKGDIELELYPEKAPVSVGVISHFMIQGGGFTPDMQKKATAEPITNEASNGLSNKRGTIAMARTGDPHSATAQFFINVQDNLNLDYSGGSNPRTWGYAVFGSVTGGMDVVDEIRFVQTTTQRPYSDVPVEPVVIEKVTILGQE
jgi:cyclophilin family peptidyl-prolyl cis-trans isomerase